LEQNIFIRGVPVLNKEKEFVSVFWTLVRGGAVGDGEAQYHQVFV